MIPAKLVADEDERLKDLASFNIMDSLPEEDYDNLTAIAAQICDTKISLISLVDDSRQWFKSHHGLDATETPRDMAFCAHAIHQPNEVFIIEDAREDERFHDNPLVEDPKVIFYAGVPLKLSTGRALGTLCVIDDKPKTLNQDQLKALKTLSQQVMRLLELRKSKAQLESSLLELGTQNEGLKKFAYVAAHDIKAPLDNISRIAELLVKDFGDSMDPKQLKMVELMKKASTKLTRLVTSLLEYSNISAMEAEPKTEIHLDSFLAELHDILVLDLGYQLTFKTDLETVFANKSALNQIFVNLIANAIKYNDKETTKIQVNISEDNSHYHFLIQDNGPGIPKELENEAFEMFKILANKDRFGQRGNGMGLATIQRIITDFDGSISLAEATDLGGAAFKFTLKK